MKKVILNLSFLSLGCFNVFGAQIPAEYKEQPVPVAAVATTLTADSSVAELNPSMTDRVVLATDDGYAIPTAITILSCLATTKELEEIIVLYPHDGLSDNNRAALKKLGVTLLEIPEKYMDEAKRRSTKWNPLVQLRISYPELFQELRPDLRGFIHMDSDTIAVRDLKDLSQVSITHLELNEKTLGFLGDMARIPFFLAARLKIFGGEKHISGGVVGWNLEAINKTSISMSVLYELGNNKLQNFYKTEECYKLWEILRNSGERDEVIRVLRELAELTTKSDLEEYETKLSSASEDVQASAKFFVQFIKSIITFSEGHKKNDDLNHQIITEASRCVLDFLIDDSAPANQWAEIPRGRTMTLINYTEEDVMGSQPWQELPQRWNFVISHICPRIMDTKYPLEHENDINSAYALDPKMKTEMLDEFKEIHVMHFDWCIKPWNQKFLERAKEYPELYKIMAIYSYYCSQLSDEFDNSDEWKMFFASAWIECVTSGHSDCWPKIKDADDVREALRSFKPSI